MGNRIKYILVMFVLISGCCFGCGKSEKHLGFEEITSIKVLRLNDTESVSVYESEKVQELLAQIKDITWEKTDEEYDEDDTDWVYRIVCYDRRGERRINMILYDETKMFYNNSIWNAEEAQISFASLDALFLE